MVVQGLGVAGLSLKPTEQIPHLIGVGIRVDGLSLDDGSG